MALYRAARSTAILLDSLFLFISLCLAALVVFATINPPKSDVSPQPVDSYGWQYVISLILIGGYACALFFLTLLGICGLVWRSSFLLSLNILAQVALLGTQCVFIAFTFSIRTRLHNRLAYEWKEKGCFEGAVLCPTDPVGRFKATEAVFITALCVLGFLQVIQLVASAIYCEHQSKREREMNQQKLDDQEGDDDM